MKKIILTAILSLLIVFAAPKAVRAEEIHDAARAGDLAKVKALLEKDPSLVRAVDASGMTPLHLAAARDRSDVVAFLLAKGAPLEARDILDATPLWTWALEGQSFRTAELLLDKGADINAWRKEQGSPIMILATRGAESEIDRFLYRGATLPSPENPEFRRLAMLAAKNGLVSLMNRFASSGADLRGNDEAGSNLLHAAAAGGKTEIIEALLTAGLPVGEANRFGWTPLHYAAEAGRRDGVERLLSKGASIDARTRDGRSALNMARERGGKDVAEFLVVKGADQSEPRFPFLSGPYLGQKLPGRRPEPFALGIVAANRPNHGTVSFTDGQMAFWPARQSGGRMASLESARVNGAWTLPRSAFFVEQNRYDDVPFPSPDGRKLFFISTRPLEKGGPEGKENIWVMEKTPTGWSVPRPLPPNINSLAVHWQVSTDLQGNLYFGASSGERSESLAIFHSKYVGGTYANPERLGSAINGPGMNHSPFIAPDGAYLIYSRFHARDNVKSLFISFCRPNGTWTQARELNPILGISTRSSCPWVSSDGKYLFFLGRYIDEDKPFWVDAGFIEELRKAEFSSAASVAEDFKRVEKRKGD
jgi:ankyrin repeat protein